MKLLLILLTTITVACLPVKPEADDSSQVSSSSNKAPTYNNFVDWYENYDKLTEEQQKTVDAILELSSHMGISRDKRGAKKISREKVLILDFADVSNIDPVLSLRFLSTISLVGNPNLDKSEIDKLKNLVSLKMIIHEKHCPLDRFVEPTICVRINNPN